MHTLITLGLTGAVFGYWRAAPRRTPLRRTALVTGAVAAGCVAAVVGQAVLAAPIRADAALSSRIETLATGIENHAQTTGALPARLDEPALDTAGVDYTATGPRSFTLCATFATSSDDGYSTRRPQPVGYVDASVPAPPASRPRCPRPPELAGATSPGRGAASQRGRWP